MITPTIGRVVLVYPEKNDPSVAFGEGKPIPAFVCDIFSEREISVGGVDQHGIAFSRIRIPLLQDNDKAPDSGWYAEWMTYQKDQAKKQEKEEVKKVEEVDKPKPTPPQFGTQYPDNPESLTKNPLQPDPVYDTQGESIDTKPYPNPKDKDF